MLSKLYNDCSPENTHSADEAGLFCKCLRDKTLAFRGDQISCWKNLKEESLLGCLQFRWFNEPS